MIMDGLVVLLSIKGFYDEGTAQHFIYNLPCASVSYECSKLYVKDLADCDKFCQHISEVWTVRYFFEMRIIKKARRFRKYWTCYISGRFNQGGLVARITGEEGRTFHVLCWLRWRENNVRQCGNEAYLLYIHLQLYSKDCYQQSGTKCGLEWRWYGEAEVLHTKLGYIQVFSNKTFTMSSICTLVEYRSYIPSMNFSVKYCQ